MDYRNLSKIRPWAWTQVAPKRGRWAYFLSKIRPPHTQPLLFAHAVILQCLFCQALAYSMPALVRVRLHVASSVLLVLQHKWVGVLSREKQQLHLKNGGGRIFGRLRYMHCQMCGKTAQEMWELQDLAKSQPSTYNLWHSYIRLLVTLFVKKSCFTWHTISLQNTSWQLYC